MRTLEQQLHDARNELQVLKMRLALTAKELEAIIASINKALKP